MKVKKAQREYDKGWAIDVKDKQGWTRCKGVEPSQWGENKFRYGSDDLEIENRMADMKRFDKIKKKLDKSLLEIKESKNTKDRIVLETTDFEIKFLDKSGDYTFGFYIALKGKYGYLQSDGTLIGNCTNSWYQSITDIRKAIKRYYQNA
ncbi:MAG: hypothetical protein GQ570_08505 [Helicobacteraceae bacterium]|nr:hypothetical protein [Helicobacteraceae bacterium]